jgi:serine/threonine protein kinase
MSQETGAATGSPGRLLAGRYRLDDYLGGGGTAEVYRAVDTRLDRPVAIKVFHAGTNAAGRRRFEDEAKLLARLDHPGLVTVYDSGTGDGDLFLVMQLVEGRTLGDVTAHGPLPATQVADLGRRLADVLDYVHSSGVIHRDVKPSNVLVAADGRVFLADFGISRLVDAVGRVTTTGMTVGTAAYMAPEQVRGTEAGPAIDIYALGLVLLECATGQPAYTGNGVEAAVARLARPPHIPPGLPATLAEALREMTAFDPGRRPTATRCVALLAAATDGETAPLNLAAVDAATVRVTRPPTAALPIASTATRYSPAHSVGHSWLSRMPRYGWGIVAAVVAALAVLAVVLLAAGNPAPAKPVPTLSAVDQPPGVSRLPQDLDNLESAVHGP